MYAYLERLQSRSPLVLLRLLDVLEGDAASAKRLEPAKYSIKPHFLIMAKIRRVKVRR